MHTDSGLCVSLQTREAETNQTLPNGELSVSDSLWAGYMMRSGASVEYEEGLRQLSVHWAVKPSEVPEESWSVQLKSDDLVCTGSAGPAQNPMPPPIPPIPPMPPMPAGISFSSLGISVTTASAVESRDATPAASISAVLTTCRRKRRTGYSLFVVCRTTLPPCGRLWNCSWIFSNFLKSGF